MNTILTTPEELAALAAQVQSFTGLGLDTEFLRERTYRAELCLLQLSSPGDAVCIDPLAIANLGALVPAFTSPAIVKVMHASRQDLEVMFPAVGLIQPVFDTQIAAALTGLPAQIGYADLVRRLLGTDLAKSHTRTDWSRRPLSPEQIEYALDDVRFLLPLRERLEEQLDRLGRRSWLAEELAELADPGAILAQPEQAWLRIKGLSALDPGRTRLARNLGAWRERRAIARNRPRGWILEDSVLREIVNRVPRSEQALASIPEIPGGLLRHSGSEILECVSAAQVPDPAPALQVRQRPDPAKAALIRKLATLSQSIAAELGLSPEVLATRRDLEQLACGRRDGALLRGWRLEVIGEQLLAAL